MMWQYGRCYLNEMSTPYFNFGSCMKTRSAVCFQGAFRHDVLGLAVSPSLAFRLFQLQISETLLNERGMRYTISY